MNPNVILRDVTEDDLLTFYEQQLDPIANRMAAFTPAHLEDLDTFKVRFGKALTKKTILKDGKVAGYVLSFEMFGEPTVAYWIGREFWGQGVGTSALSQFLDLVSVRPLYARAAKDNIGSIRVLEKNGFRICGEDKGYSHARAGEVEEYLLMLAPPTSL